MKNHRYLNHIITTLSKTIAMSSYAALGLYSSTSLSNIKLSYEKTRGAKFTNSIVDEDWMHKFKTIMTNTPKRVESQTASIRRSDMEYMALCSTLAYTATYTQTVNEFAQQHDCTIKRIEASKKNPHGYLINRGDAQATVFVKGNEVTIAFQGTASNADVLSDLDGVLQLGGRVHKGFFEMYHNILPELTQILEQHQKEIGADKLKINFTGHSMGGALAQITAHHFAHTNLAPNINQIVTFGAPACFSKQHAQEYNATIGDKTLRVHNPLDPVSGKWIERFNYTHAGNEMLLSITDASIIPNPLKHHAMSTYLASCRELPDQIPIIQQKKHHI
jgi:predicted lipase